MRTDDDSWDITESVGATAVGVAAMRAAETRRPDALFQDPYAQKLVDAVGSGWSRLARGEVTAAQAHSSVYGPVGSFMTARTVYFDDYFRAAAADGIRQIVILAAGLDARAYRLEWPSGTVIFELDQPKVLEFKATVLADDVPAADRREVAVDLRQDWPKALRDSGFDPAAPTAWLAEGLLRYLPHQAQDLLFENIVAASAPRSRIALNLGLGQRYATAETRAARADILAQAGIRVDAESLWYPTEGRADPREWFAEHGWTVTPGDAVAVLTGHGREVPETAVPELNRHILMTATRGEDDR
ncbi:class I SAM-dependent methyltransferase [Nocardia terpenica]|uniref:S-adenosyl-L-methionine-dependent methyltransferase n=1 Tax=Nocardia terpenica TaxID=455432 RepID=A0A164MQK4_9NOCA|nr:class I SAM-dependent methyltransferase [Nocardia terpenica]KZM73571.1 SAM-dependent methyltransferase [Nocardia terpenica]NQE87218.1 class I SAM-dependent methyltransferase [Nocardia terpenica]